MASKSDGQIIIDSEIQTDGIQKDIQEVRASVEKIVSQLSKLEKSFEDAFSGGSAAGAVSEQNKIQSELSETEQDIKSVTDADQQLNSQMNKDASGKYKDLQSEINQTDTKMSGLKSTAGSTATSVEGAASDMSEAFNNLNDNLDEVNKNTKLGNLMDATENLSGAGEKVIDFAKSTVEMATDVQGATSRVNAYFGLTGDAADEMAGVVENVFKSGVTDSLDEVADATILVKNNIQDLDNASLEKLTGQAIVLEQTFGSDMSETMRGVNALMTNFGLDAQTAMDLVVSGTQNGLDKTQELGDNLSEYSGKFAQAGYSAEEYFQLLNNGLEGGAYNLDKVNDSINEVTTRLADGTISDSIGIYSEKTQELFEAWQNGGATQKQVIDSIVADISGCQNQQEALNMATTAFGTMAEDGGLKVISSLTSVGNTYDDVSGKAAALSDATTTPMQELQSKINETKLALAPLGTTLLDLATQYLPPIIEGIQNLIGFFTSLPGPVQKVITVVALLAAGFLVLAPSIASIATILSTMFAPSLVASGTAAGTSAIGFGALSIALLPIALIIAGIIAAIVAVIAIIKNWDAIVAWFKDKFSGAIDTVKGIIDGFKKFFSDVFNSIKDFFVNIWDAICGFFTDTIPSAINTLVSAFNSVKEWWNGLWTGVKDFFVSVWDAILNNPVIQTIISTITGLWNNAVSTLQGIWGGIKDIASGVWELIKNVILAPVLLVIDLITGNFDQLKSDVENIWNNIKEATQTIWDGIKQVVSSIVDGIVTYVKTIITGMKNVVVSILNGLKTAISNILEGIKTSASNAWNSIKNTASSIWNGIKSLASSIWNGIKQAIVNAVSTLYQGVINYFTMLKNGISNLFSSIKTTAQNIPGAIKSGFQSAISYITSLPSRAIQWGKDIINGIVKGIKSAIGKIRDAVSNVADTIRSFLHFSVPDVGPLSDADEYAPDFIELLASGMSKNISKLKFAAEKAAAAMQIPDYNVSLPYMAQGVIAPGSSTVTYNTSNVTNNNNTGMAQILALLTQLVNQGSGGGTYEFKANINRKTLFDEIITEAKIRQGSNGKNPFELGV